MKYQHKDRELAGKKLELELELELERRKMQREDQHALVDVEKRRPPYKSAGTWLA